ncbi:TonB-dependent hemoglobin/transferrin/lactoferrin family receptor [Pelistega sp. MC2]|uniref:TonB-dependent hemoglobin/transferrin/lactoferrin family receptor n=1 Tax=Pelistega sp. MC2 TaxID=1720297 RepID=UPI0008D9589A|nr:TonB-dependent hemoglobin/transferrin/lactoferrin family receptor [Pelistega sp. MC2]
MQLFQLKPLTLGLGMACSGLVFAQTDATVNSTNNASKKDTVPILSSIVVTQDYLTDTPAAADKKVTKNELERENIQSWSDLSKRLDAGLNFNERNKSINIRGLDGDRVNVTEDGIPLPWLNDGTRGVTGGVDGINFNNIASINIQKGTGSHGTNALAGTVAIQTLRASDILTEGKNIGFLGRSSYSGYDNSWLIDSALAARLGANTRALIQYGYKQGHEAKNKASVGGYGSNRSKTNPRDYDVNQYSLRLEHDMSPSQRIGLGVSMYQSQSEIDELNQQGPIINSTTGVKTENYSIGQYQSSEKTQRERVWLEYDYKTQENFTGLDQISAVLYWQKTKRTDGIDAYRNHKTTTRSGLVYSIHPYGDYMRSNMVQSQSYGLNLKASGTVGNEDFSSRWMTGLLWDRGYFKQYSRGNDSCSNGQAQTEWDNVTLPAIKTAFTLLGIPLSQKALQGAYTGYMMGCSFLHTNQQDIPNVDTNDVSIYLQNTFAWNNNTFQVTPGIRYDYYQRHPKGTSQFSASTIDLLAGSFAKSSDGYWSPSIDLRYQPIAGLNFYTRYSEGFRAPTASELYMQYGSEANYLRRGNPNLQPETSRGYEIGVMYENQNLTTSLAFFDQYYKNFIESNLAIDEKIYAQLQAQGLYPYGVFETRNLNKVRIYGVEASAFLNFQQNWHLRGSLAWSVGKDKTNNTYLNSVAPLKAIISLGYDKTNWGLEGTWTLVAKRSKVRYPASDFKAGGYGVFDLFGYWAPESVKGFRVQAGLMNVFDKKYWIATNLPTYTGASGQTDRSIDYYTERGRHAVLSLSYQY